MPPPPALPAPPANGAGDAAQPAAAGRSRSKWDKDSNGRAGREDVKTEKDDTKTEVKQEDIKKEDR